MIARRLMFRVLAGVRDGHIDVTEHDGRRFGFGQQDSALRAAVTVHDPGVWAQILRGSTGLADTYRDGRWEVDDLVSLIRIAARSMGPLDRVRRRWHPLLHGAQRAGRLVPRNDRLGARRNVAAHYDLGNDLFELFLDPTLTYSCAYFESPDATLEQAQVAKLERICGALRLRPDEHLLEIGTGWGALAIHAAREYGCRVTTTTISREQHELATRRVQQAGLSDRVELLLADYRDLTGSYDKLVSAEMIEAVGWQYFDTYFERCSRLLTPDGLMLLQAITIDERAYEVEKASRSFANTHVFPGGCLPSLALIHDCVARRTDMRTVWLEDLGAHYAETVRHWGERFRAEGSRAERLGYDRRFQRLWELYLAYAEAGFRECRIGVAQLLLAKPDWRGSLPRRAFRHDASRGGAPPGIRPRGSR